MQWLIGIKLKPWQNRHEIAYEKTVQIDTQRARKFHPSFRRGLSISTQQEYQPFLYARRLYFIVVICLCNTR